MDYHFIFYIFLVSAFLSFAYTAFLAAGWLRLRVSPKAKPPRPFSIIVAARNEENNLPRLLNSFAHLRYAGETEIILVLDHCTDGSRNIAREWSEKIPGLRILEVNDTPAGIAPKKHALSMGIAESRHEWLAFTDADCEATPDWLEQLNHAATSDTQVVLGFSPVVRRPGLLNLFIRFETFWTAFQYGGMAAWGKPYMAVGRNLAYQKDFFKTSGGYGKDGKRLSGDDDLLINRHAAGNRTVVIATGGGLAPTIPPDSVAKWMRQKMRHFSAAGAYKTGFKVFLTLVHGVHALFYVSLFFVVLLHPAPEWALIVWAGRILCTAAVLAVPGRPWRDTAVILLFPFLDLLWLLYYLLLGPAGLLTKPVWHRN